MVPSCLLYHFIIFWSSCFFHSVILQQELCFQLYGILGVFTSLGTPFNGTLFLSLSF